MISPYEQELAIHAHFRTVFFPTLSCKYCAARYSTQTDIKKNGMHRKSAAKGIRHIHAFSGVGNKYVLCKADAKILSEFIPVLAEVWSPNLIRIISRHSHVTGIPAMVDKRLAIHDNLNPSLKPTLRMRLAINASSGMTKKISIQDAGHTTKIIGSPEFACTGEQ